MGIRLVPAVLSLVLGGAVAVAAASLSFGAFWIYVAAAAVVAVVVAVATAMDAGAVRSPAVARLKYHELLREHAMRQAALEASLKHAHIQVSEYVAAESKLRLDRVSADIGALVDEANALLGLVMALNEDPSAPVVEWLDARAATLGARAEEIAEGARADEPAEPLGEESGVRYDPVGPALADLSAIVGTLRAEAERLRGERSPSQRAH